MIDFAPAVSCMKAINTVIMQALSPCGREYSEIEVL